MPAVAVAVDGKNVSNEKRAAEMNTAVVLTTVEKSLWLNLVLSYLVNDPHYQLFVL
jgi:hypothetical protein